MRRRMKRKRLQEKTIKKNAMLRSSTGVGPARNEIKQQAHAAWLPEMSGFNMHLWYSVINFNQFS